MFFVISKILAPFIHPVTHIFVLLIITLIFYRKLRVGKTCIVLALLLLLIFGTRPLPNIMTHFLETQYELMRPPPQGEAVVVLSGMLDLEKSTSDYLEFGEGVERILTGIQLVKNGYGEILIISGGNGDLFNQNKSEARLLKKFVIDSGIPAESILIDSDSRNTYENAVNTKSLMEQHKISRIILVTSASHIPRAVGCFEKLDIHPIPYGVDYHAESQPQYSPLDLIPSVGALRQTSYIIHEYVGLLMYKLAGYI